MHIGKAYPSIKGRRRQAGFTLVELLVAMTLLAFLSVALFGGLRFGAHSWEAVVKSSTERDEIASTQIFLRDRLSQLTLPGSRRIRHINEDGSLFGDAKKVEFTAPWLSALSLGGLYRFTLWHEDFGNDDGQLMLRWQPAEADSEELEDLGDLAGERILLDGVTEFHLSYFGAAEEEAEPEWTEQWDNPGGASPGLVRVHLEFADERRVWPDFIVALKN
jgi:general secretion pathway protein J